MLNIYDDFFFSQASSSKVAGHSSATTSRGRQKKVAVGNGAVKLTAHSSLTSTKVSVKQRLHPGLLSVQDRATAHYGAVTGLKVTEDGMYLLSAGCVACSRYFKWGNPVILYCFIFKLLFVDKKYGHLFITRC